MGDECSILAMSILYVQLPASRAQNDRPRGDRPHVVGVLTACRQSFVPQLGQLARAFSPHLRELDGVAGVACVVSLEA